MLLQQPLKIEDDLPRNPSISIRTIRQQIFHKLAYACHRRTPPFPAMSVTDAHHIWLTPQQQQKASPIRCRHAVLLARHPTEAIAVEAAPMRPGNPPLAARTNIAARISRAAVHAAVTTSAATRPPRAALMVRSPVLDAFRARAVIAPRLAPRQPHAPAPMPPVRTKPARASPAQRIRARPVHAPHLCAATRGVKMARLLPAVPTRSGHRHLHLAKPHRARPLLQRHGKSTTKWNASANHSGSLNCSRVLASVRAAISSG